MQKLRGEKIMMKKVLWFLTGFAASVTITTGEGLLFAIFIALVTTIIELITILDK